MRSEAHGVALLGRDPGAAFRAGIYCCAGCWYGSSNIREDVPKLIELYRSRQLKLEELVSREIGVEDRLGGIVHGYERAA